VRISGFTALIGLTDCLLTKQFLLTSLDTQGALTSMN